MRYFLRCLFAACLTLGMSVSAYAEQDELGLTPSMWFKFDGNTTNVGSNGAKIDAVGGYETVSGTDQAIVMNTAKQSDGGAPTAYPLTVHMRAKLVTGTTKLVWSFGGKNYGGINFVIAGENTVKIMGHNYGTLAGEYIPATAVAGANDGYHYYTYVAESQSSSKLYYDGKLIASSTTANKAGNGGWGLGRIYNAGEYVPSGAKIADLRTYNVALTEDQVKVISTPLLLWGTAGWAGNGVSTKNDGAFHSASWSFNFSKDDGIVHDAIDLTKRITVKKIRMMQRATKAEKPTAATLTQGANMMKATSVTSYDDDATGMTLYNSTGSAALTRGYHEFIFDGAVDFDPTQNITLSFPETVGCWVTQPANSLMKVTTGSGDWSPVIEFTAVHPSDTADYTATIDKDTTFTGITSWEPSRPTTFKSSDVLEIDNTASVTLTMNEAITVKKLKIVNDEDSALKLDMQTMPTIGTYDFSKAAGGIVFDASGLDGRELAKNAVAGAPYSHWLLRGTVKGSEHVTVTLPTMPSGYDATYVVDDFGVRVVVTAPKAAKFGSVSLNLYNGDNKVGETTTDHGVFGVVGTSWNDLAANSTAGTLTKYVKDGQVKTGSMAFTKSDGNQWSCNYTYDAIFTGYADDTTSPVITLKSIPFEKYRVIVYRSTDNNGGKTFTEAKIGTSQSDAISYFGPTVNDTVGGFTVGSGTASHNWGKSTWISGFTEGVNYIASGVLTGGSVYIASRGANAEGSRGCVSAIQIVEVGQIIEGVTEFKATISAAGTYNLTDLDWTPTPFAPTTEKDVKIVIDPSVKGEVTVNLNQSNMSVKDFVLVSSGDATMTLTGNNPTAISSWDFSGTKGRVAFAFSTFDEKKVIKGTYPRLGLAYPYTGTIQSGYDYIGTGNKLTFTTFNSGSVLIGGSGTLHGDLNVLGRAEVYVGGTYTSPDNDVEFSSSDGYLTVLEGADISVTSMCCYRDRAWGGTLGDLNIYGTLRVTSECGADVGTQITNHKGVIWKRDNSSTGMNINIGPKGAFLAEKSWIMLNRDPQGTCNVRINGGIVKARGINVGNYTLVYAANPSINLTNGGVLQLAEGLIQQNNATYSFNDSTLAGYSYGGSTGYEWTPLKTSFDGTLLFDLNGVNITVVNTLAEGKANSKVAVTNSALVGAFTVNSTNAYTGGTMVLNAATLKLGGEGVLGSGAVTVFDGATIDCYGHALTNAVTLSGAGAKGGGALVNTGNAVNFLAKIRLSGDATIGGSKAIGFSQGSGVDAAAHALTLDGDGMTLKLGGMTVSNCVALAVTRGTLASNGAISLGNADLSIGEYGILNLAGGNSLSCSNFVSKGTVEGVGARLIVSGEFDASSAVTIPRLKLKNDATLRGVGLKITDLLEMEERLYVWVPELKSSVTIAAVPESKDRVTLCKTVVVNGTSDYAIQHVGEKLVVKSGGVVNADVALTSVTGGLNFEELWIEGVVREFSGKAGAGSGKTNVNVIVTYADGSAVTQKYDYVSNEFRYVLPDFDVGRYYGVQAFLTIEGAEVDAYSAKESAVTARTLDAWIDENWETFDGRRMGTGAWADPDGIAEAVSKDAVIAYAASNRDEYVCFTSTNRAQIAELGGLKDVHISETFKGAAYCLGKEEPPALEQTNGVIAVAVATNVLGECQFAVVTSNGWQLIGRETFEPSLNVPCEIVVRIDEGAGTISYGVVRDEAIVWILADGPYQPWSSGLVRIVFFGAGRIAKIAGTCHDTNLAQVTIDKTTREYATFEEALEVAGADNVITPLWWSNAEITGQRGAFCVKSNGYFEPIFAKWYHYEKTPGEAEDRYRYIAANNWIEYSDEGGVEREANGAYRVTSEQGLAWIAEQATNGVFEGAVTLGENLDLSSKNWTPIANFTGSFDGKGFTIDGLNNTNVIVDPLLGEAGHYYGGVTNASGYTAYGLFGCTKDAAFRNITLRDVAISNTADSVSALVGVHALGDLTVENVTNASGVVWGEGAVVAGLVTIGGNGGEIGNVVVKDNANRAEIVGAENAAQILAGTSADTKFMGTVDATGNGGEEVPFSLYLNMPICNFAAAIERYDEQTNYWRYVEANEKDSVPIDPVNRTARMLAGYFDNGTVNYMGQLTDKITASEDGAKIVVPNATTNDCWSTVLVDRNITLDLGGTCIYGVYDCDLFTVTNGAKLIVGNGELVKVEGFEYYRVATGSSVEETQPLAKGENSGTFYDRTVGVKTFGVVADQATIVISYTSPDFLYTVQHVSTLAEEWKNVEKYTDVLGTGGEMTFELDASEDSGFYRVKMVPWWYQPEE